MFAHQVVEDFNKYKDMKYIGFDDDYNKQIKNVVNILPSAVSFHLDNIFEFYNSVKLKGVELFEDIKEIKLAYPTMWIDFKKVDQNGVIHGKAGFLLYLKDKFIYVFSANYNYISDRCGSIWYLLPEIVRINIEDRDTVSKTLLNDVLLNDNEIESLHFDVRVNLGIFYKLLLLLTCKNVTTEVIKAPEKLNRKRQKNNKCPLFDYHTLVLQPTTKYEKSIPQHLWENRIHLCRGHFKTYTEENKLFGRLTGRYWWQPQARGNKKLGVVMKDYVVKQAV